MVGDGRTAKVQAGYQLAGLAVALGIAIIGGIITGRVINLVKLVMKRNVFTVLFGVKLSGIRTAKENLVLRRRQQRAVLFRSGFSK